MESVVIPTFIGLSVTAYMVKKFGSREEGTKDQPVITKTSGNPAQVTSKKLKETSRFRN
jgi:hypothetical protein